jgi:hypothetical protein
VRAALDVAECAVEFEMLESILALGRETAS